VRARFAWVASALLVAACGDAPGELSAAQRSALISAARAVRQETEPTKALDPEEVVVLRNVLLEDGEPVVARADRLARLHAIQMEKERQATAVALARGEAAPRDADHHAAVEAFAAALEAGDVAKASKVAMPDPRSP
jgi:hypothetical protein